VKLSHERTATSNLENIEKEAIQSITSWAEQHSSQQNIGLPDKERDMRKKQVMQKLSQMKRISKAINLYETVQQNAK
jgi:hypothetical protein